MTPTARILTVLIISVGLTSGAAQVAPACDDDDCGNASAGLTTRPPNDAVQAAFTKRSYAAGAAATLKLRGTAKILAVQVFRAGSGGDGPMQGAAMTASRQIVRPGASVSMTIGDWPSGLYYARVETPGAGTWYAPFVFARDASVRGASRSSCRRTPGRRTTTRTTTPGISTRASARST